MPMNLSRSKLIALFVALVLAAFLIGFLPQWFRARGLAEELEEVRFELEMAQLEGLLGAALAEAGRSNYERARQLLTQFYPELQDNLAQVEDPADRRALQGILNQRDEIVTLLSRAEPESMQRLLLLYTQYFSAIDPAGTTVPTAVTPSPPGS